MRRRVPRMCGWALLCGVSSAALAAGSAVVTQTAAVRATPSADAAQVVEAPPNEPVNIIDRRGAWYEVSSSSGWRGWVRLAAIRLTALTQKKGTGARIELQPASVGVRGLDEASLAHAQPDYAALQRLRQYRSTPQEADRYASELPRTQDGKP